MDTRFYLRSDRLRLPKSQHYDLRRIIRAAMETNEQALLKVMIEHLLVTEALLADYIRLAQTTTPAVPFMLLCVRSSLLRR